MPRFEVTRHTLPSTKSLKEEDILSVRPVSVWTPLGIVLVVVVQHLFEGEVGFVLGKQVSSVEQAEDGSLSVTTNCLTSKEERLHRKLIRSKVHVSDIEFLRRPL